MIQNIIVYVILTATAIYSLRAIYLAVKPQDENASACGTCGGCEVGKIEMKRAEALLKKLKTDTPS